MFTTPRSVRFRECEYAVPAEALPDAFAAVRRIAARQRVPTPFPVEVRFAAADDVWLSTAYARPTGYLAVHQDLRLPHARWFREIEAIALAHDGRPHWGKLHSLGAADLTARHPRLADFRRVRDRVDPHARFTNPHLNRILGPAS